VDDVSSWPSAGVLVVIPAFNEERTIAKVLVGVKPFAGRIIVCDDGSTDTTAAIARAMGVDLIQMERNVGKGESLRRLMKEAARYSPAVVVTIDADDQHDPSEIPKVASLVLQGEADLVIGARSMKFPDMPMDRIMGNRVLDAVTSVGSGIQIRDSQSGFRAYSLKAIQSIQFRGDRMTIESQTLMDAADLGLRIKEVPISARYRNIPAKRSRLNHFSEVLDYLLGRTIVDSPILYLGVPGIIAILVGLIAGFFVIQAFVEGHGIAIGTGLISATLILVGTIMTSTSLILKFISAQLQR
jgi:glycosyltransferase involved in cell wall biosynthesis